MQVDVLQVPSMLSLSLQECDVDVVQGIKQVLKAAGTRQSLVKKDPLQWPTDKLKRARMSEEDDQKVYSTLTHFTDSVL